MKIKKISFIALLKLTKIGDFYHDLRVQAAPAVQSSRIKLKYCLRFSGQKAPSTVMLKLQIILSRFFGKFQYFMFMVVSMSEVSSLKEMLIVDSYRRSNK